MELWNSMVDDDLETNAMNESFNDEEIPYYHWKPVALYNYDGTKIRDLTKEEQIAWIKEQLKNGR